MLSEVVGDVQGNYKILSQGEVTEDSEQIYQVVYEIESNNSLYALYANELQLREIHFFNLKSLTNAIYCLIQYENSKKKFIGQFNEESTHKLAAEKEKFLKIFDFWSDNKDGD